MHSYCIVLVLYHITLQERCGAPYRIACLGFFNTVHQYCIGKAMQYNSVALVCIAFQYDADAMYRFFNAMHCFFDAIPIHGYLSHHIALFHHCYK
jgi:hypothetical protein